MFVFIFLFCYIIAFGIEHNNILSSNKNEDTGYVSAFIVGTVFGLVCTCFEYFLSMFCSGLI